MNSWFDILKNDVDRGEKKREEKRKKLAELNRKIRTAHQRLSRQIKIDPQLKTVETRKLIKLMEHLAEEADRLNEE